MSLKLTKLIVQTWSRFLILPIAYLSLYLLLSSCQSVGNVTSYPVQRPLAELMIIELAVQRQEPNTVNSSLNKLLRQPLSNQTYNYLYRLLKGESYRKQQLHVADTWIAQYPDEQQAIKSKLMLTLCTEPQKTIYDLILYIENHSDLIIERFMGCLDASNRSKVAKQLFESLPNDPRAQLLYINDLLTNGHTELALVEIKQIAPANRSEPLLRILANAQFENNELNAAQSNYQRLLSISPYDQKANFTLAKILYEQNSHQAALPYIQRVLDQKSDDRPAQYLMAKSLYALGNWSKSEDWFLKLLTASNYRNRAFYYLGEIAVARNQINQAIEYFSKVKRSDYFLSAQLQLWRIIAREQPELASMGLQQLAKEFPSDSLVIQLAEVELLEDTGKSHQALQQLINLADDYPNNLRLQLIRLRWLVEQDHLANITQNVLASLSGLPEIDNQFQLLESAIFYLISQGVSQPAVEILEQQKYVPRNNTRYLFLEGVANAIDGNYQSAIQGLKHLLQLDPNNAAYMNALGYTMTLSGNDFDEAKQLIEKALTLAPENSAYLDSLAWLYYKQGSTTKALTMLRQALNLEPSASIYSHLIEILISQGELRLAEQQLEKAAGLFPRNRVLSLLQDKF